MKKKSVTYTYYLEEISLRLISLDWIFQGIKTVDIACSKTFIDFIKTEIEKCLILFDKYYLNISTQENKVLKSNKTAKKGVKSAQKKPIRKRNFKNKKSKK